MNRKMSTNTLVIPPLPDLEDFGEPDKREHCQSIYIQGDKELIYRDEEEKLNDATTLLLLTQIKRSKTNIVSVADFNDPI